MEDTRSNASRLFLAVVLFIGSILAGQGENFSGLQGKELAKDARLEDAAVEGLGRLFQKKNRKIEGDIQKVTVVCDEERRLTVKVSFSGLAGNKIWGEIVGRDKAAQRPIQGQPVNILSNVAEVQLVFTLDDKQLQEPALESLFLKLNVAAEPSSSVPGLVRTYVLPKRWQKEILPENVVIKIKPRPEGAAASLGGQPGARPLPIMRPRLGGAVGPSPRTSAVVVAAPAMRRLPGARPGPVVGAPAAINASGTTSAAVLQRQAMISRNTATAVAALPAGPKLVKISTFNYGLNPAVTSRSGRGPGPAVMDLLAGSDIALDRESLANVCPNVLQDQNPQSGIFYYFPHAFYLDWKPDQSYMGYSLRMLYSAARTEGQAGEVLFACRLNAGVDTRDIQLATELLRAYTNRFPATRFTELRPLPIERPPDLSFSGGLQRQYNIPADKIAINAISDMLGETDVSWVTDTVTKDNLQMALVEDVGITGTLTLTPAGGGLVPQLIPVSIKLATVGTFGEFFWVRGQLWRNQTPYPLRLKYLHMLLLQNNLPVIYSWNLEDTTVPPLARVEFDAGGIPAWLDTSAKRMWLDYSPIEDCQPCDQNVMRTITAGVTSLGSGQITFHTIKPLADTGAYEISLQVRSKYFDPHSREPQTKPDLVLNADDKDFTMGPIYLGGRQSGEAVPGDPLFEYFMEVAMPDGTLRRATRWIASDNLRVLIGKVQIEQATGSLPPSR